MLSSLALMQGGEIFVPKIPSMKVADLATAMAPGVAQRDRRHPAGREAARGDDHARTTRALTLELDDRYIICAGFSVLDRRPSADQLAPNRLRKDFRYSSDGNAEWLSSADALHDMLKARSPWSDVILPYGRQSIDDADIAAVADVLRGDYLTTGPDGRANSRRSLRAPSAPNMRWAAPAARPRCTSPRWRWGFGRAMSSSCPR